MEITEIRIIRKEDPSKKLRAFVNVTFDGCFVVRDMKVVEGTKGLFVAMPSRRMKISCPQCRYKNFSGARFCTHCGAEMPPPREHSREGRESDHKDIAHPITLEFREKLQKAILEAYQKDSGQAASTERPPEKESPKKEERPSMSLQDEDF